MYFKHEDSLKDRIAHGDSLSTQASSDSKTNQEVVMNHDHTSPSGQEKPRRLTPTQKRKMMSSSNFPESVQCKQEGKQEGNQKGKSDVSKGNTQSRD